MKDADHRVAQLAQRQHGVFSRRQALAAGLSPSALSRRVASGRYVVAGPSSLRLTGPALTYRGELSAGLLDLGPLALITGHAAAHLLGLDGFQEGPLEFLVPRSDRHHQTLGMVRSTRDISTLDRVSIDGLASTSATRTVIELLAIGSVESIGDALDSAVRKRLTAHAVIQRRLDELGRRGRDGVAMFGEVVRAGLVESGLEREFVSLIGRAGLPTPVLQRRYELPGVGPVRTDFEFLTFPIVVEVGGRRGYFSAAERQQKQRRCNALQSAGKIVYFFTTDDIRQRPDEVIAVLWGALNRLRAAS